MASSTEFATVAGGCFWGMEKWYRKEFGAAIKASAVGYIGGLDPNPTYKAVCSGTTGHAEALQLEYYPDKVTYEQLLQYFFRIHDPTTPNRQGNDVGTQYRSAIFYHSDAQKAVAEKVKQEMQSKWNNKIATEITKADVEDFHTGEDYHQKYLDKNPGGYCNHRPRW